MPPSSAPESEKLAARLRLLLDAAATKYGSEPTFRQIALFLERRGITISRSRWQYMLSGKRFTVKDEKLLTAIAEYFDVEPTYLLDMSSETVPATVEAQLGLVRAMRAAEVKSFAARALGDVSPETLKAITKFLEDESGTS